MVQGIVLYVDVCDSNDEPVVFAHEDAARRWVAEHRPDWKVEWEDVRQRWVAKIAFDRAVEEARDGGWYRPGPAPEPLSKADIENDGHQTVYVAHSGLTTFVFADASDAEATYHVWSLSPEHGSRHRLHAVTVL
jgi:hypothetical protein